MVSRYREGRIPAGAPTALDAAASATLTRFCTAMDGLLLHEGLEHALALVRRANAFVDEEQPWELARDPARSERLDAVLGSLVRALATVAALLSPFIPSKAEELWRQVGGDGPVPSLPDVAERIATLERVRGGSVLFPRAEATV